ncbi:MAG: reverse transcriptase domain-containing protein, partial [Candidatus Thiodiazotropha sp.]
VEHILNKRHNARLGESQSHLQKGFTAGSSSIDAALILSECIAEAKNMDKPLILATLDAQKAFDVVDHCILLRKLFSDGITGDDWLLLHNMYVDLTSVVKWEANLSNPINIRQGVRQGGVLSTSHYKRYNNPLLLEVENRFTGALIGHIQIPHVTVADDLALLTHSQLEMQFMLDCSYSYAGRNRYVIHPTKSCVLTYPFGRKVPEATYFIGGDRVQQENQTKHLGVLRDTSQKPNIPEKINLGRRTAYSLMGAGFHSMNGLKQSVNGKLWSTYVIPRVIYGLEVLHLRQSDISQLEQYQRKSLKQIQHLPDRTQTSASLALLGVAPVEMVLHKNMLSLFWRWITSEGIERDICLRQLAMKASSESSWFNQIRSLLNRYDLPPPSELIEDPPSKSKWKSAVENAISTQVEETWREDIQKKNTLKYINPDRVAVGQAHPVWASVRDSVHDSRRAQVKCRLLTGTYTLQSNKAVFNQHSVDPTCKICKSAPETRQHFLAECPAYSDARMRFIGQVREMTERLLLDISSPDVLTRLILDPSVYTECDSDIYKIELHSRELIDTLHYKRLNLLLACDRQWGLAVSGLNSLDSKSVPAAHTRLKL